MTGISLASTVSALGSFLPGTRSQRLLTLIYHRVLPEADPMFPGDVTRVQFEWQMSMLRRYFRPIALRNAVEALREGTLSPRAIAVTFDDGYRDNVEHALPILLRHDIPATFFIATSFLDGGIMWNDAVIEAIRMTPLSNIDLRDLGMSDTSLISYANRGRLAEGVIRQIKHLPADERLRQVERVIAICGVSQPRDLMMGASDVVRLYQAGMEVGAHTRTHPILSKLNFEAARNEIAGSRDDLEGIIGARVTAFAYPNGRPGEDYGPRDRQIVEELGFQYAPATRRGVAGLATDRFQLPRFTPWDLDPARWLARLLLEYRRIV